MQTWRFAARALADASVSAVSCCAIVGAKGAGKSTFARFLANVMLSRGGESLGPVALLECDLGQPLLGPTGLVSLRVLDAPLLSPTHCNAAHVPEPLLASFFSHAAAAPP